VGLHMSGKTSEYLIVGIVVLSQAFVSPAFAQTRRVTRRATKFEVQQAPATPTPPAPAAPLTPAQLPAVPPQVSYQNGQLMILAHNSTLGDILRAVSQQTGVSIDIPGNATERVVGRMGPGAPRDVLVSLLNGSHFDYVMTGTPQNPASIDRVLLMPKSGSSGADSAVAANAPQPGVGQVQPPPQPEQEQPIADEPAEELSDQDFAAEQPAQDEGQQDQADQQAEQQPGTFNGQPAIKTPQQLLQELQQRQAEQQQQQQQGAPQGVPTPAAPQGFPIPPGAQPPQPQPQSQPEPPQ